MLNLDLFEKICISPGAPGYEDEIRDLVKSEVKDLCDELKTDTIGNLITFRKGKENKSLMVAAHMDEIGFIIKHIDENGFLMFHTLGGFDPKTLTAQKVIVHGKKDIVGVMGTKPIHVMTDEEKKKPPELRDYYIDIGYNFEEASNLVSVGDTVTRKGDFTDMGECISCKSLDNRVAVYLLIETLKKLKNTDLPYDLYATFTVQEELGLRGVMVASHNINPDFGIAIDTTVAYDTPGAKPYEAITKLGNGVAIKVMDSMTVCDPRMIAFLKKQAGHNNINYQMEVLTGGGTDTAMVQRMGKHGSIAGAVSIPTRNLHQVTEMCNKSDIEAAIGLLNYSILNINTFNWDRSS